MNLKYLSPEDKGYLSYVAWGCKEGIFHSEFLQDELVKKGCPALSVSITSSVADGSFDELLMSPVFSMAKVRDEKASVPYDLRIACPQGDYWVCDEPEDSQQKKASKWGSAYHIGGIGDPRAFIIFFLFGHPYSADRSKGESASWVFKGFVLQIGGDHYYWEASPSTDLRHLQIDLGCGYKGNHNDDANSIINAYGLQRQDVGNPLSYFE
jgi:hypothetical protein